MSKTLIQERQKLADKISDYEFTKKRLEAEERQHQAAKGVI